MAKIRTDFDLKVDKARFPYTVYADDRPIAHIYTYTMIEPIRLMAVHIREINRLREEKHALIKLLRDSGIEIPSSIEDEGSVSVAVEEGEDEFEQAHGVVIGQLWQSRRGNHDTYRITDLDMDQMSVTLSWVDGEYTRKVEILKLPKYYDQVGVTKDEDDEIDPDDYSFVNLEDYDDN